VPAEKTIEAPERVNVLGVGLSAINEPLAMELIGGALRQRRKGYICVTGVHGVMESQQDAGFRGILNHAFLNTPDGMPMVWVGRLAGYGDMDRVYGPDLMLAVCGWTRAGGFTHFLYGGGEGVAEQLRRRLEEKFPGLKVAGTYTPPFRALTPVEEDELVARVNRLKPDIIWVGLSTPKQERFMAEYLPRLDTTLMFGVGAAFDFHAGRMRQAPRWMQRSGLEWLFRLFCEPRRLWRRYLRNNPRFLGKIFCQLTGLKKYNLDEPGRIETEIEKTGPVAPPTRTLLGTPLALTDYEGLAAFCAARARAGGTVAVDFSNTHVVTLRRHEAEFREMTREIDFFVPDGMPLVWCLNRRGAQLRDRVYGPAFMKRCLAKSPPTLRHYFLGGSEKCLARLQENLRRENPALQIVGARHGYFKPGQEEDIVAEINRLSPDFIWVGLGTPRQQAWIHRHKGGIRRGVVFAVGFAFDVNAGMKPDAPLWMQRRGLTWVYRLANEPRRLLGRYLKYNSLFLFYLLKDGRKDRSP
jgi:N-acetylglucosaminyldiphosphoundecaprenol N-acetyl-beta-D-mannosaminyltransferase